MEYLAHILIMIGIYAILAMSLDLLVGHTGLLSVAHAAFFGVGAYTGALACLELGWPFPAALALAVVACVVLGVLVGLPSLRIRDDYFLIATFAFQIAMFCIMQNWTSFTGGPMGVPGIPPPQIMGWTISGQWEFLVVVMILAGVVALIASRLIASPLGRVLRSIREDEIFVTSLGKNVAQFKVMIISVSAGMAGVAGVLYAEYFTFIDPSSFTVMESILILAMVIIGGAGSLWGPVVGAAVLVILPELLRFTGLSSGTAADIRQILYGAALLICMLLRPQGIRGRYLFQEPELTT